jgi:hypothetical protein
MPNCGSSVRVHNDECDQGGKSSFMAVPSGDANNSTFTTGAAALVASGKWQAAALR